jgi:nicotinamidase-related amidase
MSETTYSEGEVLALGQQAYLHGRARFDIKPERAALLVIDMQDEFVRPGFTLDWVPAATRQAPRIARLIKHCRDRKVPVIYTVFSDTHTYLDRPFSGPLMANRHPDQPTGTANVVETSRIWHEVAPRSDEIVIHKPSYGAFYDTPLHTILRNLGRDTVIISGTLTNFCCGATARQAYERGFLVVFGSDINATDDQDMHEAELKVLRRGFALVLTANEIMAQLGGV